MAANVNIVVNAHDRASGVLRKIRGAFGEIVQVALGVRLSQTLQRAGEALRNFASESIDAASEFQQFQIGVETLVAREQYMKNLSDATYDYGDAVDFASEMSEHYINQLQDVALLSPYQFGDVQKAYRQAMAFGFGAEEAIKFVDATLNVAAGVGASNQQLDRMAYNLAQIRLQGKVTKLDIRQLALAGFDLRTVLTYVGDQMGVTVDDYEDFNKAIENGSITWEDFTTNYANYADEYFGGASERMAKTLFGLRNTIKDVFMVTMPQILGPSLESFSSFAGDVIDSLIELRDSGVLEEWGERLKVSFDEKVMPVLNYLLTGEITPDNPVVLALAAIKDIVQNGIVGGEEWPDLFEQLTGIDPQPFINFVDKFGELIGYLKEGEPFWSDPVLANLGMAFGAEEDTLPNLKDDIVTWATDVWEELNLIASDPLGNEAAGIAGNFLGLDSDKVQQYFNDIRQTSGMMGDDFVEIWTHLKTLAAPLIETIQKVVAPIWALVGLMYFKLAQYILPAITGIIGHVVEFFADNADVIAGILAGMAAFGAAIVSVIVQLLGFFLPIVEGIVGFVLKLISAFIAWISGDKIRAAELLLEGFANLGSGIVEGIMNFVDYLKMMWDEVIQPILAEFIPKIAAWGADLLVSLATGFANAVGNIGSLIGQGIQGLIDWVTDFLKIGSPSKVFEEFGALSMQGFVEGFQPDKMLSLGVSGGITPAMKAMGTGGGQTVIVNNHYNGLTLNDRLEAEQILRPIVERITR